MQPHIFTIVKILVRFTHNHILARIYKLVNRFFGIHPPLSLRLEVGVFCRELIKIPSFDFEGFFCINLTNFYLETLCRPVIISAVQNNPLKRRFRHYFIHSYSNLFKKNSQKGYNKQLSSYSESIIIIQEYFVNCDILV